MDWEIVGREKRDRLNKKESTECANENVSFCCNRIILRRKGDGDIFEYGESVCVEILLSSLLYT